LVRLLSLFFKGFIYLFDRDTAREGTQAGRVGEGEAGFPWEGAGSLMWSLIPGLWDHDLS